MGAGVTEFESHVLERLDTLADRISGVDSRLAGLERVASHSLTQATPPPAPSRGGAMAKGVAGGGIVAVAVTAVLDWLTRK